MKRETEIWVLDCPLFKEDGADDCKIIISFCQGCEYCKSFTLLEVECGYPDE